MAQVWLAEEINFRNRQVAIKAPRPSLSDAENNILRERFKREVDVCAELAIANTPNVVQALTHEVDGENGFLVMEYMPGGDLGKRICEHPHGMPVEDVIKIAKEILIALDAIHNHPQGIIHRDIKPSNILFNAKGETCLGDFGLAQVSKNSGMLSQVLLGQALVFTPAYRAPELKKTGDYSNATADIFSLGCVIWEMLTGRIYKDQKPGTLPSQIKSIIPDWLDVMVLKCLHDNYWDRWQNAIEILNEIHYFSTRTMVQGLSKINIESTIRAKENDKKKSSQKQQDVILDDQKNEIITTEGTVANNNKYLKIAQKENIDKVSKPKEEISSRLEGKKHSHSITITNNALLEHFRKIYNNNNIYTFEITMKYGNSGSINKKLSYLKGMEKIKNLSLNENYRLNNNGLKNILGLTNLERLDLSYCDITDNGLINLTGLINLKYLFLRGCKISNVGLIYLNHLTNLLFLDLSCIENISALGLEQLNGLTNLNSLHLWNCTSINNDGLQHITGLPNLTQLDLRRTQISDTGLANLKKLTDLTHLNLSETQISDAGLEHIKGLTNLTELRLSYTGISDAGLAHLKNLHKLTNLDLDHCKKISNMCVAHLKELPNLTIISLYHCNLITDEGLANIEEAMPNLHVRI